MENRSFSFRALLLAGAAIAGLVGAVSLFGEGGERPAAPASAHLTAAQKADLQAVPAPVAPAMSRESDREPGEPASIGGEEPTDGSGS
jgi:hypothetical protein